MGFGFAGLWEYVYRSNIRLKDFYDILIISKEFGFEGQTLVESIIGTFNRRSTDIPMSLPTALTEEFANDA